MYLFVALFEDLFYSFVLNHYSHSLILCKLMGFKNSLLGYDTALLSTIITTVWAIYYTCFQASHCPMSGHFNFWKWEHWYL